MSEHMDRLREDEEQARHEQVVNEEVNRRENGAEAEAADAADAHEGPVGELGQELGTHSNDTSKMDLLNNDLDELIEKNKNHEPNPEIQEAIQDLKDIPVREAIEKADS